MCSAPDGLAADYYMQTYSGLSIVRTWATVTNRSGEAMGLEHVSSFFFGGIGGNRTSSCYDHLEFWIPHNGWSCEAQWQKADAVDLGLSHLPYEGYNLPEKGNNRYVYGSGNSWSTSSFLPMGIVRDAESGEVWFSQIDYSGAWTIEYGSGEGRNLYVCLLGPDEENEWWKCLQPGESFTTVPAAFGTARGGINEAIAQLTQYRRRIRRRRREKVTLL